MTSEERRLTLTGPEAKAVYTALIPEGGDGIALGKWLRASSVRGKRPTTTPTLSRSMYKRVRAILKDARKEM